MHDPWQKRFVLLVAGIFLFRLAYLATGWVEIVADEAYYWVWSKHPDWSYYSKGPLVAYLIWLSTAIGGDTEFFVRLPALLGGTVTLIFAGRLTAAIFGSWRAAFWTVVLIASIPTLVVGSLMMTIDNPALCFWTLALFYTWRAASPDRRAWDWPVAGLVLGLALMAKAVAIFFVPSLLLYLFLNRSARPQLKTWGPWAALAIGLALTIPQIVWNAQHDWVMFRDFADKGDADESLEFDPLQTLELIGTQLLLYTPLIYLAMIAALLLAVRRARNGDAAALFVLCFSLPVFAFYGALSLNAHVNANWMLVGYPVVLIALSGYANERWDARPERRRGYGTLAAVALLLGAVPSYALFFTEPLHRLTGSERLARLDVSSKIYGSRDLAAYIDQWRDRLDRGRPIFIFDREYLNPSVYNFYCEGDLPAISLETDPYRDQYYFIADLESRKGHDAIAVLEEDKASYVRRMKRAFREVEYLEEYPVMRGDVELRRYSLYHCKDFIRWKY